MYIYMYPDYDIIRSIAISCNVVSIAAWAIVKAAKNQAYMIHDQAALGVEPAASLLQVAALHHFIIPFRWVSAR